VGAPGITNPPNYLRTATTFHIDYRDDPERPRKGVFAGFGGGYYNSLTPPDRNNFFQYGFETRIFLPLWSMQRVLALRAEILYSKALDGNRVPFFMMPSLGGGSTLRGFDSYRFRGEKLMLYQAEYRWEASRRVEFALFGDAGTVANKGQHLSFSTLKADFGVGIRFRPFGTTVIRVDQAWSNERARTTVRFSMPF
jgi:outer membrane protein assembly factor BamA